MVKSKKRKVAKAKPIGRPAPAISGLDRSVAMDYFRNAAARMGYGTPSLPEATEYDLVRLSNNYWLMLTLYRNHWISRRIVDLPAQDMTRAWCRLSCQLEPDEIKRFDRTVAKTFTANRICQTIKWARLYGGSGALIAIKGHENRLEEPLDLDDVNPGTYLGLIPFDRWSGIQPSQDVSTDMSRPLEWGLPRYYEVTSTDKPESRKVHASRILRFTGPTVPSPETQAQMYWGISVLEVSYEELRKRDNASFAMLQLLFRANILAQKNPELAQMLSGLGMSQQALQNFSMRMQAQNELLSNQSMLILGADGELQSNQFSFSGLAELYGQFQMDVAGAAEIPVTRLFGRTVTGLGQSNDADERIYEEKIATCQDSELRPQLDKLYPVICMSEFGEVPDDLGFKFPSVRILTEEEKGDLADKGSAPVIAAYNAGLISQQTALKELRELSDRTGIFTNITDEDIDAAEEKPVTPSEGFGEEPEPDKKGGGETGEVGQGGEGKAPGEPPNPKKFARPNPLRQLREEAGGAMDEALLIEEVPEKATVIDRALDFLRSVRDSFRETDHPREKGGENAGQFASKGSGSSSSSEKTSQAIEKLKSAKAYAPGSQTQADPVESPIKVVPRNDAVMAFRTDRSRDRNDRVDSAPTKTLKTEDLKSSQPNVDRKIVSYFIEHPEEINKPKRDSLFGTKKNDRRQNVVVAKTDDGLYVMNGNHRVAAASLLGVPVKAKVVDLTGELNATEKRPEPSGKAETAPKARSSQEAPVTPAPEPSKEANPKAEGSGTVWNAAELANATGATEKDVTEIENWHDHEEAKEETTKGRQENALAVAESAIGEAEDHPERVSVVRYNGKPIGVCSFGGATKMSGVKYDVLNYLAVHPDIIGGKIKVKGVGTALMISAAKRAAKHERGLCLASLDDESSKFYEKLGMKRMGKGNTFLWSFDDCRVVAAYGAKELKR
jgi:phage-related protein (TIGR01555 family)